MKELAAENTAILPAEYEEYLRIRDMWANHVADTDIRNILGISEERWNHLMSMIKQLNTTDGDNFIQFQKFKAKTDRRNQELEELRILAMANDELPTAVKCYQLQAIQDKDTLECAQKLGVLKGEVIRVEGDVKIDVRLAAILANLPADKQEEATQELVDIAKTAMEAGVEFYDGEKSGSTD